MKTTQEIIERLKGEIEEYKLLSQRFEKLHKKDKSEASYCCKITFEQLAAEKQNLLNWIEK